LFSAANPTGDTFLSAYRDELATEFQPVNHV